jgi:hypothetical protein
MVCQNCGSNDIVAIQGQNYCINCGQLVTSVAAAPAPETKKVIKPAVKTANAVKTAAIISSKVDQLPKKPPRPQRMDMAKGTRAHVLDLKNQSREIPEEEPSLPKLPKIKPTNVVKSHTFRFTLKLAVATAIPLGALFGVALWLKLNNDVLVYACVAGLVLLAVTVLLAQGSLLYGKSKALDGRPASESTWWAVGRGRFVELLSVNILHIIALIALGVAAYGFSAMDNSIPASHPSWRFGFLLVANGLIAWLLIGVFVIRRLSIAAISVGGFGVFEAVNMAAEMFNDYGAHVIMSAVETLLVRLVGLLAIVSVFLGAARLSHGQSQLVIDAAYAAAVAIGIIIWLAFYLNVEMLLWLRRYRWVASKQDTVRRTRMLTGGTIRR